MIWNAVAVDQGRVFVAGPRWTGSQGPALGLLEGGAVRPYPDATWNGWARGQEAARAFVNVNAVHLDGRGGLWAVDTGSPDFGGDPLPGGAKLVRIGLESGRVDRVVPLGPEIAGPGSYVDDARFRGDTAYLTDAGRPGLIVLDLRSGAARRVLDGHPSTMAPEGRAAVLDGQPVRAPDGGVLRVNADPLELTPDGQWLLYGPLTGPWSRIQTRLLDDPAIPPARLAAGVEPWVDLPPVGGTAMDGNGDLYFTDLAEDALKRLGADGRMTTILRDPRLHWVDAPFIDAERNIWLPVPQMDRVALFNGGRPLTRWPVQLFRLPLDRPG
nr:major royal jelly family protein [Pararoseomonas indoligenes]